MVILINNPETREALSRVFSFEAPHYNLDEYEKIVPGSTETILAMVKIETKAIVRERSHSSKP
jgi:uncharacterized membrane protein